MTQLIQEHSVYFIIPKFLWKTIFVKCFFLILKNTSNFKGMIGVKPIKMIILYHETENNIEYELLKFFSKTLR